MMKVKALIPFTQRDSSTGALNSVACGAVIDVTDAEGATLISDGMAEAYTLVSPTGKVDITSTDEVDVTEYASAQVVDTNLTAENIKKDVTILGVTGTYEA